jgi:probable FeS assembly SUF system protein SufT
MHNVTSVELLRDCEVIQIPSGIAVTLPAGTIHGPGGLYRVAAQNAGALGLDPSAAEPASATPPAPSEGPVDEKLVWDALKTCYDPEIPVNIVDLGLVYDLHIERQPAGGSIVSVKMTLTAPGCGMGATIAGDAQQKILYLPGVEEAVVEIVWDPPWHQSMITGEGRKILGLE